MCWWFFSQAVAGYAQMCRVEVKLTLFLPFCFCLKLVSVPEFALCVFASSSKWIKKTEWLAGPLCSRQKELANKKEQIPPTEKIYWNPSARFCSADAPRKTGQIIIISLKSHVDTKGSIAVCAVLLYNRIPRFLSEISFLLVKIHIARQCFWKYCVYKDTWYFSWGLSQYTELFCLVLFFFFF